jgi:hypothetical protein
MSRLPTFIQAASVRPSVDLGEAFHVPRVPHATVRHPDRSLMDLFEQEVDALHTLHPDDRERLKRRARRTQAGGRAAGPSLSDPVETVIRILGPVDPDDPGPDAAEDRRLETELRGLLAQRTDLAGKLAVYVHALQARFEDRHRPHVVVVT